MSPAPFSAETRETYGEDGAKRHKWFFFPCSASKRLQKFLVLLADAACSICLLLVLYEDHVSIPNNSYYRGISDTFEVYLTRLHGILAPVAYVRHRAMFMLHGTIAQEWLRMGLMENWLDPHV